MAGLPIHLLGMDLSLAHMVKPGSFNSRKGMIKERQRRVRIADLEVIPLGYKDLLVLA